MIPSIIKFVFKNFWLLCIVVTLMNAFYFKFRARSLVKDNPDLEEGYNKVFWGTLIFAGIPWLVMGIGTTIGGIPTLFHFFRLRDGNPYVIAYHFTIVVIWILTVIWIYFKDGANFWIKYMLPLRGPSLLPRPVFSVLDVKIWFALCLLGGLVGITMMWLTNIPVPDF